MIQEIPHSAALPQAESTGDRIAFAVDGGIFMEKPRLIEDLGMIYATKNSKNKTRFGIYECFFCGSHFKASTYDVNHGRIKSCKCIHRAKPIITDKTPILIEDLGIQFFNQNNITRARFGIYECRFCGKHFRCSMGSINTGNCISCGCYKKDLLSKKNKKHDLRGNPIYNIWKGIKSRCRKAGRPDEKYYYEKGIIICDEWINDPVSFYNWALLNGYKKGLEINRIDNDKGYSPENCNFVDHSYNMQNTRLLCARNKSRYRGVCTKHNRHISQINFNRKKYYLGSFDTPLLAAIAYNDFVIKHKTHHPLNPIP